MATKLMFFVVALIGAIATCSAGIVPALPVAAAYVAPYASTYNAHVVNHAIAAPVAAPVVAAPLFAAPAHYSYPHAHAHAHAAPFVYSEPLVVAK